MWRPVFVISQEIRGVGEARYCGDRQDGGHWSGVKGSLLKAAPLVDQSKDCGDLFDAHAKALAQIDFSEEKLEVWECQFNTYEQQPGFERNLVLAKQNIAAAAGGKKVAGKVGGPGSVQMLLGLHPGDLDRSTTGEGDTDIASSSETDILQRIASVLAGYSTHGSLQSLLGV